MHSIVDFFVCLRIKIITLFSPSFLCVLVFRTHCSSQVRIKVFEQMKINKMTLTNPYTPRSLPPAPPGSALFHVSSTSPPTFYYYSTLTSSSPRDVDDDDGGDGPGSSTGEGGSVFKRLFGWFNGDDATNDDDGAQSKRVLGFVIHVATAGSGSDESSDKNGNESTSGRQKSKYHFAKSKYVFPPKPDREGERYANVAVKALCDDASKLRLYAEARYEVFGQGNDDAAAGPATARRELIEIQHSAVRGMTTVKESGALLEKAASGLGVEGPDRAAPGGIRCGNCGCSDLQSLQSPSPGSASGDKNDSRSGAILYDEAVEVDRVEGEVEASLSSTIFVHCNRCHSVSVIRGGGSGRQATSKKSFASCKVVLTKLQGDGGAEEKPGEVVSIEGDSTDGVAGISHVREGRRLLYDYLVEGIKIIKLTDDLRLKNREGEKANDSDSNGAPTGDGDLYFLLMSNRRKNQKRNEAAGESICSKEDYNYGGAGARDGSVVIEDPLFDLYGACVRVSESACDRSYNDDDCVSVVADSDFVMKPFYLSSYAQDFDVISLLPAKLGGGCEGESYEISMLLKGGRENSEEYFVTKRKVSMSQGNRVALLDASSPVGNVDADEKRKNRFCVSVLDACLVDDSDRLSTLKKEEAGREKSQSQSYEILQRAYAKVPAARASAVEGVPTIFKCFNNGYFTIERCYQSCAVDPSLQGGGGGFYFCSDACVLCSLNDCFNREGDDTAEVNLLSRQIESRANVVLEEFYLRWIFEDAERWSDFMSLCPMVNSRTDDDCDDGRSIPCENQLQCQTYQSHGHSKSESYTDAIISNVFEARNIFFDNIFAGHNRSEVFDWVVAHILSKVSYYFFFVGGTFDTSTH